MPDDDLVEDELPEEPAVDLDDEIDDDVLGDDDVPFDADDDVVDVEDVDGVDDVAVVVDDDETEDEPAPRGRKKGDDDESDDDDELDPDDVEADLQSILDARIAAEPDEEDEEELEVDPRAGAEVVDGVAPKRANEFMCNGCFLLVSPAQFGKADQPRCPVGEDPCPAIPVLFGDEAPAPVAKAKATKAVKATKAARKR